MPHLQCVVLQIEPDSYCLDHSSMGFRPIQTQTIDLSRALH